MEKYNLDFYVLADKGEVVFSPHRIVEGIEGIDPIGHFVREKMIRELKMIYPEIPECEDMVLSADLLDYKVEGVYAVWGYITKDWMWVN